MLRDLRPYRIIQPVHPSIVEGCARFTYRNACPHNVRVQRTNLAFAATNTDAVDPPPFRRALVDHVAVAPFHDVDAGVGGRFVQEYWTLKVN